jgi:hypothetical protein
MVKKKIVRIGISVLLMASAFAGSAFAESPGELNKKIQPPSAESSNQELKDKIDLEQFKIAHPFDEKALSRSSIKKASEDDILFEVEPNDYVDEADDLPFLKGMIGSFYWENDQDIYKIKVTSKDQYMIIVGITDDYPLMQLLYGVFDSRLNLVEPEIYEYVDGLYYQVVPVKPGDYYVLAFDQYRLGTDEPYMLMADMIDVTPPSAPALNPIDDNDTVITGKAEKGSTVTLKNGSKLLGSPKADGSGNFKLAIKPLKAGTKVTATATDAADNVSKTTTVTVSDKTAPAPPKVNPVDDNDKSVSGKTEANANVTVKNGKATLGTVKADKSGNFKLAIKPVKAGTKLTFTAKDAAGNVSKTATVTVVDKTAPSLAVKDIYSSSKSVSGKTEAGAKVTVKIGKTTLGSNTANSKGEFKITIKPQKKGTTITISATDKAKNTKTVTKKVK